MFIEVKEGYLINKNIDKYNTQGIIFKGVFELCNDRLYCNGIWILYFVEGCWQARRGKDISKLNLERDYDG